jgi:probable HAF family extracellular repeat protein
MHDLGTLGASIEFGSSASGINDSGQVTGRSKVTVLSDEHHAFLWTPTEPNGSSGKMIDLGTPGEYTYGTGINDSGQVTGSGSNSFLWEPTTHGGDTGLWIDWNSLGGIGIGSTGFGINATGQVTGLFSPTEESNHAFLWTPATPNGIDGTTHDLGTLGGTTSWGFAINARGQVVGRASTEDESLHAFLWTPTTPNGMAGEMRDLGTLGGGGSVALAINDHGSIVGLSEGLEALGRAFIFSSADGMVDLNSLIDGRSGWVLQTANAINNAGQITGYGDHDGVRRAFLLTPVPEPSTSALWGVGGVALALFIRSRARRPGSRTPRGSRRSCALAALTTIVLVNARTDRAAADLVGPTPYLQASDSPFAAFMFDYFHLEDFEDGLFSVPGVIKSAGNIIGPGPAADSVDADDGTIDGSGNGGRSLFVVAEPLTFTFDAIALGRLPTHVGVVRTDGGNAALGGVASFEVFGPGMISLGTIGPVPFGDGVSNGTTAEDRFFGWFDPDGILAVRMPSGVFEVDHLQYGVAVPEPSAAALLFCALAALTLHKLRKAALRLGFARMSPYAVAALLCHAPTAGASDFVIDQQHYTVTNVINEIGLCCGAVGQEFTPTLTTLDTVDVLFDGFRSDLFLNVRAETITGPIIASSTSTVPSVEKGPAGRFVQFQFEPPVSVVPGDLYVIEIVSPVEIVPPEVYVVNDGAWQYRDEYRYTRGRMIGAGEPHEGSDIAFRTGSRRLGGTVYESGFEYAERLPFQPGPLDFQIRDWQSTGVADAVTISALQPSQWPDGGQAIQIKGTGLVPAAGGLIAAAFRSSNLHPFANGNPLVSMKANVRLDGPMSSADGGIDDDLISANVGVTDGAGATIAELILSSNGNAYAFAGNNLYNFETPVTQGEFQTVELRLNYLSRSAEFLLNNERLGALPFAAEVRNVFGEPFFALSALDSSLLNKTLYSAWFDELSIQQTSVPEPAAAAMLIVGTIALFAVVRMSRIRKSSVAAGLISVSVAFLAAPRSANAAMFSVNNVAELISAIDAANQNGLPDTISLSPATMFTLMEVNNTLNGSTGLPTIADSAQLAIIGNGSVIERSMVVGTPSFRLFDVASGASLALDNLTLQGGSTGSELWGRGGAIYNAGDLALAAVTVQNNFAQGRNGSFGIRSNGGPGGWGQGGAIYSEGALILENSELRNNQAVGGNGGFSSCVGNGCGNFRGGRGGNGEGGGLYAAAGSVTLRNSVVTQNEAEGGLGGSGPTPGSPGFGIGGGVYIANSQVAMDSFTLAHLTGNTAATSHPSIFGTYDLLPELNLLHGDYNGNGAVDAADYVVWRDRLGSTYTRDDYNVWRAHFGQTTGSGAALPSANPPSAFVPEPSSFVLVSLCLALFVGKKLHR